MVPAEITDAALNTCILFCSELGIKLKKEKSPAARRITFVGIEGDFPCSENGYTLSVNLTKEKADIWVGQLLSFIKAGPISSNELGKLIGKMGFSQANSFGKFARAQMRPLYQKFYAKQYVAKRSTSDISISRWLASILSSLQPRIPGAIWCGRISFFILTHLFFHGGLPA